jgi:hypothetical protein
MIGKRLPLDLGRSSQVSGLRRPTDARARSVLVVPRSSRPRASTPVPGLVEHHEPLAPGERHVDPDAPHGRARRDPGHEPWYQWRAQLFGWLMPVMSVVAVWAAVDRGSVWPALAAVPWTASSLVALRGSARLRRSAGGRRDSLRFSGTMLVALLLLFAGIPLLGL